MPSFSNQLVRFGIYLAKIYFIDYPGVFKVRPVLLIDEEVLEVVVLQMTTNTVQNNYDIYFLEKWESYGLNSPTAIRLDRTILVSNEDFYSDKLLGKLSEKDIQGVAKKINLL
jgi:hypothetical protein